jgi:hypothetical protein
MDNTATLFDEGWRERASVFANDLPVYLWRFLTRQKYVASTLLFGSVIDGWQHFEIRAETRRDLDEAVDRWCEKHGHKNGRVDRPRLIKGRWVCRTKCETDKGEFYEYRS